VGKGQIRKVAKQETLKIPCADVPYLILVSAIVQQLPREGKWTASKRQHWMDAMTSAIDLLIEVSPDETDGGQTPLPRTGGETA